MISAMGRLGVLMVLLAANVAGLQEEPEPSKPRRAPRQLVLATAEEAAAGWLAWADEESVALITDRGERAFRWEDLRPYSVWRARSALAERDAAKRLALAAYC